MNIWLIKKKRKNQFSIKFSVLLINTTKIIFIEINSSELFSTYILASSEFRTIIIFDKSF